MKKIKYITKIMLILTLIVTSCTDMLIEEPLSSLSPENLFKTEEDGKAAVNGMYSAFTSGTEERIWGVLYPVYGWGIMGTDIWSIVPANTGLQSLFSNYNLSSATDQVKSHWTALYRIINRANNIIVYAGNIDAGKDIVDNFIAEARFIRAFCYMDLVQFYGGVPLRLQPTKSIEDALGSPRVTEEETWAQIIADLEFAEQYLPENAEAGKATKWAAKGLLAKAYLTRGGYPVGKYNEVSWFDKAAKKAYEVIAQSGRGLNPTTPGNPNAFREYGKQFLVSGQNSPESLFEIQFLEPQHGSGWGWRSIQGGLRWDNSPTGSYYAEWGGTTVGSDFALSFNDNDIRFQWSIGPFGLSNAGRANRPFTNWSPYKFRWETQPGDIWGTSVNAIVLRMADVYLLFAEAANEATGDPNNRTYGLSAYEALNVVRERAQVESIDDEYLLKDSPYGSANLLYGMSLQSFDKTNINYDGRHVYYSGTLKERFRNAVLMERGWELCFERHRWFDLKRTGKLVEYAKKTIVAGGGRLSAKAILDPIDKSDWLNAANMPSIAQNPWPPAKIQDRNIYMPIPDVEIQINPALTQADQNPGY